MSEDAESGRLAEMLRAAGAPDEAGILIDALPFSREIGMRLHSARDGVTLLSVRWDERLIGDPETGVLHGGVISALLDTACGSAVLSAPGNLRATATLDLRIDYMRPATRGRAVLARAECYRVTRSIAFTRAVAYHDDPQTPVASAAGSFIVERPKEEP